MQQTSPRWILRRVGHAALTTRATVTSCAYRTNTLTRAEDWSGVPLRWMLRRIGYGAAIATVSGVAMAAMTLGGPRDAVGTVALLAIMATTFTAVGHWQTRRGASSSRSSCAGLAAAVAAGALVITAHPGGVVMVETRDHRDEYPVSEPHRTEVAPGLATGGMCDEVLHRARLR